MNAAQKNKQKIAIQKALEVSELRYRRLFETAQDGILLVDFKTGMIMDANQFLINLLGYSKADFLKKHLWEVGIFKDVVASKKNFKTLQAKKYVRFENLPLETKTGEKKEVEFVANAYQVGSSTIIQCNIRDIAERKKSEEKIKEVENYFVNIINTTGDPIFMKDENSRFVLANNALSKMLGIKNEDIIGKTLGESLPKDQMDHFLEVDRRVLKTGKEDISEEHLTGNDGKVLTIVTKKTRYIDKKGNKFLIGVIHDITERKNLEMKLLREKQEQDILLDSVPGWIFYKDVENRFIRVNKAFADVMGMPKNKLENKSLFDIFPKKEANAYWEDDKKVIKSGKPRMGIIESMKSPKGEILWLQTDKIPYRNEMGKIIGIIGFTVDMTHHRETEGKLKETINETEKMNKLMVGRELKMIELKNRIAELENKK